MNSRTRLRSALAVILTVLALVPTAVLFTRTWQDNSDDRSQVDLERKGVEYLTRLTALIGGLAEAQSSAMQDVTEPPDSLTAAVTEVSAVDARLGGDLGTTQRWAGLQSKITNLPKVTGGKVAIYQAHVEAADLALALYGAVRRNSGLVRDAEPDISNLQQAVAVDMPTTMIEVSRMGDLAQLLAATTGPTKNTVAAQFALAVLNAQDAVNTLTDTLQNAVDDTTSTTLSGNLVSALDSFRRGVESMARGANPGGTPNVATMSTAQTTLQTSLTALAGVVLKEIDELLADRQDTLGYRRAEALVAAAFALLLAIGAVMLPLLWKRRKETGPPAGPGENVHVAPDRPGSPYGQFDLQPNYGDLDPTWRERSGALR
jgi:hypothetical protein